MYWWIVTAWRIPGGYYSLTVMGHDKEAAIDSARREGLQGFLSGVQCIGTTSDPDARPSHV